MVFHFDDGTEWIPFCYKNKICKWNCVLIIWVFLMICLGDLWPIFFNKQTSLIVVFEKMNISQNMPNLLCIISDILLALWKLFTKSLNFLARSGRFSFMLNLREQNFVNIHTVTGTLYMWKNNLITYVVCKISHLL